MPGEREVEWVGEERDEGEQRVGVDAGPRSRAYIQAPHGRRRLPPRRTLPPWPASAHSLQDCRSTPLRHPCCGHTSRQRAAAGWCCRPGPRQTGSCTAPAWPRRPCRPPCGQRAGRARHGWVDVSATFAQAPAQCQPGCQHPRPALPALAGSRPAAGSAPSAHAPQPHSRSSAHGLPDGAVALSEGGAGHGPAQRAQAQLLAHHLGVLGIPELCASTGGSKGSQLVDAPPCDTRCTGRRARQATGRQRGAGPSVPGQPACGRRPALLDSAWPVGRPSQPARGALTVADGAPLSIVQHLHAAAGGVGAAHQAGLLCGRAGRRSRSGPCGQAAGEASGHAARWRHSWLPSTLPCCP